jgi:hypothetical protein
LERDHYENLDVRKKRALFEITSGEGELKIEENDPQRLQKYTEDMLLYFHQF